MAAITDRVADVLGTSPLFRRVRLVGSRANGTARPLSDWDFAVETDDFEACAAELPELVAPLEPLARQWDPLGERRCYMLIFRGPAKVDLIFDELQRERPPWTVSRETLPAIDAHFWDWILWIAAKDAAGRHELVATELAKMSWYLLRPMGARAVPASVAEALGAYQASLPVQEAAMGVEAPRDLAEEVGRGIAAVAGSSLA